MVLTAYSALSLVTGLSCHHHRRDAKHHRQLDASVGASGPHGFAVRKLAPSSTRRLRPPHPAPTSVTIAIRPSKGTGWRDYGSDLGKKRTGLFLREGLDRCVGDLPVGQKIKRPRNGMISTSARGAFRYEDNATQQRKRYL
jgi:hypothetical protein